MKDNEYRQALQDAIFGDTWEKFVSHKDFLLWCNLVRNRMEKEAEELFDNIMLEVGT